MFDSSAAIASMSDEQKQEAQNFSDNTYEQALFTVGATLPANLSGDAATDAWYSASIENPEAMSYTLEPITN